MVQFASYLRCVLCKARLIFPRINGPIVSNARYVQTCFPGSPSAPGSPRDPFSPGSPGVPAVPGTPGGPC